MVAATSSPILTACHSSFISSWWATLIVARRWSNFHGICRQVLCPERLARNSLNHCQEVFDTVIDLADQQFALPYAGD